MIKFTKILGLILIFSTFSSVSSAQIEMEEIKNKGTQNLYVTGFYNYYPFGYFDKYNAYHGVLTDFMKEFAEKGMYRLIYLNSSNNYEDTIREFSKGDGDVVLGIYNETSLYMDLKYIYPAAIDNPVHLVMLPSRIREIKAIDDLKKLKGAIHSIERFGDYVNNQLKDFNIEYIDNSYDLYGKLMTGEIDFIFTSFYFGVIETSKLGLRSQVAFSKQSIWVAPLFIGISKASFHRDYMVHSLSRMLEKPEAQEKIKNKIMEMLKQVEIENAGTVPPTYINTKEEINTIDN